MVLLVIKVDIVPFLGAFFLILLIDIVRIKPLLLSRPYGGSLLFTHALVPGHLIRCDRVPLAIGFIHARIEYALALLHVDQDHARWRGIMVMVHELDALI